MNEWTIRSLTASHPDARRDYQSIAGESLHYYDDAIWDTYIQRVGAENIRCIWRNGKFAGGLAFYRTAQWYGQRQIGCAGFSGVGIDPAARGSGACRELLQQVLIELHQEKMPMASLYASTQRLYRRVGFEHSGYHFDYSLPMSSLAAEPNTRSLPVSRQRDPSIDLLARMTEPRNRRTQGNLERTPGMWERILRPVIGTTSTYIIGDDPEGFITLLHGQRSAGHPQPLVAIDWVANTPCALQRMIALIVDHRSMCDRFQWSGGPQDPILLLADEQRLEIKQSLHTLNRIVCLPQALEQRGYPRQVAGRLQFYLEDELLPENTGYWTLEVDSGVGRVSRGGDGLIRTKIREFVPLFTSLFSCRQLSQLGKVECSDSEQIALADQIFSGAAPWTCEIF
ncbi:MAG: GNAT family N-acetyltransferase [bacterium]|nr:GNAT family N-acetyltransferase [bacterium]